MQKKEVAHLWKWMTLSHFEWWIHPLELHGWWRRGDIGRHTISEIFFLYMLLWFVFFMLLMMLKYKDWCMPTLLSDLSLVYILHKKDWCILFHHVFKCPPITQNLSHHVLVCFVLNVLVWSTHDTGTVKLVAEGPHEDGDNDSHEVVHETIVRLHPQELQGKKMVS